MIDFLSAITGGFLTGTATLGGQFLLARREDKRWTRQHHVQREEWRREDRTQAFDYKRDAYAELISLHREWQRIIFDHVQNDRDLERKLAKLGTIDAVEREFSYLLDDYHLKAQKILAKVQLSSPENVAKLAEQAISSVHQYHYSHTPEGAGLHLPLGTDEDAHRLLKEFVVAAKSDLEDSQTLDYTDKL